MQPDYFCGGLILTQPNERQLPCRPLAFEFLPKKISEMSSKQLLFQKNPEWILRPANPTRIMWPFANSGHAK